MCSWRHWSIVGVEEMRKGTRFFLFSAKPRILPQEVEFEGIQRVGFPGFPDFGIYNTTMALPGHPAGTTLSRRTLEVDYGYIFPKEAP